MPRNIRLILMSNQPYTKGLDHRITTSACFYQTHFMHQHNSKQHSKFQILGDGKFSMERLHKTYGPNFEQIKNQLLYIFS